MATRTEANVVYAAGVVQGIALVTFPAASTIFTDPDEYDLSSTQYGTLFLPQVIAAIADRPAGRGLEPLRHQARLPGRPRGRPDLDGRADRQPVPDGRQDARIRAPPRRHGVPGRGLRPQRAGAEHVRRRVSSGRRRPLDPGPQRAARARHCAGAGVRGDLRRPGVLVGAAADIGVPAGRAPRREPAAAAAHRGAANRCGTGSTRDPRRGSGSMRGSPCSTASARPSTATGRSWT